jgi:general secretion pathway protein K
MSTPARQRGAVVIVAMLIVALAAISASAMLQRQDASLRQLEAARDHEQARWLLQGGAHWARMILAQDARSSKVDHAGELWASGLPPSQVEEATISGEIRDAQGLFNLNNLVREGKRSERDVAALKRLLPAVGLRPDLADALVDWIDADSDVTPAGGAEDADYLREHAPYRAANRPLTELAELHRVRGFDEAAVARLRQLATALPARTPVNVNLAPPQVLAAIVEGLTLPEALELTRARAARPFAEREDFRRRLPRAELRVSDEDIAVQSQYFEVRGRARVGKADVRMQILLQREGTALPAILWQRIS